MGTGLYPQGLKEIQIGLPCRGNMNSTRRQAGSQGSGLTSTETSNAISWVTALGLSCPTGNMRRLLKGFLALIFHDTKSSYKGLSYVRVLFRVWFARAL